MRSIPRYPEVREDGSMWVPLAPPPAPTYRQMSETDAGMIGQPAAIAYSTEWLVGLQVLTDPYRDDTLGQWFVQLGDAAGWCPTQDGPDPYSSPSDVVEASVRLVYVLENGP